MSSRRDLNPVHPSLPEEGFYRGRMVKNGPWVPIRIWYQFPLDPVTGEELDRSGEWKALRLGQEIHPLDVWPFCSSERISESEYEFLLADHQWHAAYDPDAPQARPRDPINLRSMNPVLPPRR